MELCLVILICLSIDVGLGHKNGAPLKACLTMIPGHEGTGGPQPVGTAVHKLEMAPAPSLKNATANGDETSPQTIVVTLSGKTNFKGFFVQARSTVNGDVNPVGSWDVSGAAGLAKGVDCGAAARSAATHVDSSLKPSVTLLWSPPSAKYAGKVVFVATVVEEFKTYWVGIQSQPLNLGIAESVPNNVVDLQGNTSSTADPLNGLKTTSTFDLNAKEAEAAAHPLGSANNDRGNVQHLAHREAAAPAANTTASSAHQARNCKFEWWEILAVGVVMMWIPSNIMLQI